MDSMHSYAPHTHISPIKVQTHTHKQRIVLLILYASQYKILLFRFCCFLSSGNLVEFWVSILFYSILFYSILQLRDGRYLTVCYIPEKNLPTIRISLPAIITIKPSCWHIFVCDRAERHGGRPFCVCMSLFTNLLTLWSDDFISQNESEIILFYSIIYSDKGYVNYYWFINILFLYKKR